MSESLRNVERETAGEVLPAEPPHHVPEEDGVGGGQVVFNHLSGSVTLANTLNLG